MPGRKVLLIIDVQQGFMKRGMGDVALAIRKHCASNNYDLIIQSKWVNHMGSRFERDLGYTEVGNSEEERLLIEEYQDTIIERTEYSCLTPRLRSILRKEDTIYVAGVDTDACVLATLFALWDGGYTFHVLKNLVATGQRKLQEPTLQLITRNFGKRCLV